MENKNGLAGRFYLILALTSRLQPPIMSWYSRKNKQIFMNAHKCVHNIDSWVPKVHLGSRNYTEFAYQFLSMIIVSPLSSHNIYLLWPIAFIPAEINKEREYT